MVSIYFTEAALSYSFEEINIAFKRMLHFQKQMDVLWKQVANNKMILGFFHDCMNSLAFFYIAYQTLKNISPCSHRWLSSAYTSMILGKTRHNFEFRVCTHIKAITQYTQ